MSSTMSLRTLLEQNEIVIPIIQRDYAQGRIDASSIRVSFLKEIKNALEDGNSLTLDFVYGNETIDNKFQPLDGQQRLTTLWLLNWYLLFKLGRLNQNDTQWLSKFTYETRISSRNFIQNLCKKMSNIKCNDLKEKTIADYIKKQTWFYAEWEQDPTIDALLRTLSGNNDGKEDNIETLFNGEKDVLTRFWNLLNNAQLVNFEELTINSKQLPVSDDLYIKMNARGKQLTNFENFKADLIKYIKEKDSFKENEKNEFSIKMDCVWTDVFWKGCVLNNDEFKKSENPRVDEALFMFINRYLFNEICLGDISIVKGEGPVGKYKELYDYLYGRNLKKAGRKRFTNDDTLIKYENFDLYGQFIIPNHIRSLNSIMEKLKAQDDIIKNINIFLENGLSGFNEYEDEEEEDNGENNESKENFNFISKYLYDNNEKNFCIKKTELKERVYFLAICRYIESNQSFDVQTFKRWMRIVKNLTENAQVENESGLIQMLKMIDGLAKECKDNDWDVYSTVERFNYSTGISLLNEQLIEEKEKIEQIKTNSNIEETIVKAENYSFFNGTIRFLYHNDKGEIDWSNFDIKFDKAQKLFKDNKIETKTVKDFLSLLDGFFDKKFYFTNIGYHNRIPCWKRNILCDKDCCEQVHLLLTKDIETVDKIEQEKDKIEQEKYKDFIESKIIDRILDYGKYSYQDDVIHKAKGSRDDSYIYVDDLRINNNKIIDKKATIKDSASNYDKGFYIGTNTPFTYNDENYCLKYNNELWKCDENWNILNRVEQSVEDFFK